MFSPDDHRETTVLDTHGLLIKNQSYRAVLTSQRIILTGGADDIPRSIILQQVLRIDQDTDPSGDPVIVISMPSAGDTVHSIVLHFPRTTFPNAFRLRALWASEINGLLQQSVPSAPPVTRQAGIAPSFCPKCGNRLAGGSAFCDRCGERIPTPVQQVSPETVYSPTQDRLMQKGISTGLKDLSRTDQAVSVEAYPADRYTSGTAPSPRCAQKEKNSFFSGISIKKTGIAVGVCLAVIVIIAAAFIMTRPSGSSGFDLTSAGLKLPQPNISAGSPSPASDTIPPVNRMSEGSKDARQPSVSQTQPALTFDPGDPEAVVAQYPSLFNNIDAEGITRLLTEEMKTQYPVEDLSNEIDASQSTGNRIEKIQVKSKIIEGNTATLITDIVWKTSESQETRTQNLILVNEGNQWKLNTLILHP